MRYTSIFNIVIRTISRITRWCHQALLFRKSLESDIDEGEQFPTKTFDIEWGVDLDEVAAEWTLENGDLQKVDLKGRCARCWGGLVAQEDEHLKTIGIKCRVCGEKLEGELARDEDKRMQEERSTNLFKMSFGSLPRYAEDATFLQKILPVRERMSRTNLEARVQKSTTKTKQKARLSRRDFPIGSPGLFVLQATMLMASVENISHPDAWSIVDFPDVRFRDDGTAVCTLPIDGISEDPQFKQRRIARRMGQTFTAAMISAFACELTMKAISLTIKDEAIKTHDLVKLYDDLPDASRERIAADYAEIEVVLDAGREMFGVWRHFETATAETAVQKMINTELARNLGKAVRVLLDEAEMVGLGSSVNLNAKERVRVLGNIKTRKQQLKVNFEGREAPPKQDPDPRAMRWT